MHSFLLFYANDSVDTVWMADFEGAYNFDHSLKPKELISQFVEEYHCEPDAFDLNDGVTIDWFAGASIVSEDRYHTVARFEENKRAFVLGNDRFARVQCWNRIVHPQKKFPKGTSGCEGEEIQ